MDARSLCTKIPSNEGVKAVETPLKRKNLPAKVISFMKLILTLNNFIFNCTNFLQIKGYAILAIFMGIFEETHIYPLIK